MTNAEQLQLGGMPKRLFSCTPSRLAAFDCPRRYFLTYLVRPTPSRGQPWAHNTVGSVAHLALAKFWSLPPSARTPSAGGDLVERNWPRTDAVSTSELGGFRDGTQSQRHRTLVRRWVERYLAEFPDAAGEPVGVERTVGTPVGRLAVSGRVDRLDERVDGTGGLETVVVDYKTGRRGVSVDHARGSLALALYVLGVRRSLRRECRRVELHHLPTGEVAAFEHTDESLSRHVARAEAIADDIEVAVDTLAAGAHPDELFPPAPAPSCSWCDFRAHCTQGRAASETLEPWAGLAEES